MLKLILAFYLGIIAQAIFLLAGNFRKEDIVRVSLCLLAGLYGLVPFKHEYNYYDVYLHLFFAAIVFCVAYACFFKKKILQSIDKEVLLVWNFVFLYIYFQHTPVIGGTIALLIVLFGSLLVILNAFLNFDSHFYWKAYFYIWFLVLIVGIASSHFAFESVSFFLNQGQGAIGSPAEIFFVGSAFLYLVVNAWYVVELIPLPGKRQSFKERLVEVKEDVDMLASEYKKGTVAYTQTLSIIILTGSFLAINYYFHLISDLVVISIIITFTHYFAVKKPVTLDITIGNTKDVVKAV